MSVGTSSQSSGMDTLLNTHNDIALYRVRYVIIIS